MKRLFWVVKHLSHSMSYYIEMLAKGKMAICDVPEKYRNERSFIQKIEKHNSDKRRRRISLLGRRGFDVIHNRFFIEQYTVEKRPQTEHFDTFNAYFEILNGDIYNYACYYQYCFSDEELEQYHIDIQKLNYSGLANMRWKKASRRLKKEDRTRVKKGYEESSASFYVSVSNEDGTGTLLYAAFDYFFDFVSYLDGDLSSADLLLCEGIANLKNTDGLKLDGAHMTTATRKQLGLLNDSPVLELSQIPEFGLTVQNDKQTRMVLKSQREDNELAEADLRICYITDLHLMHQIRNAGCLTEDDAHYYIIQETKAIVSELEKYHAHYLLIAGDISSDFEIYKFFTIALRKAINKSCAYGLKVLVTLGNHELWAFPELDFAAITEKYRAVLEENHMHLLQNDLYCLDSSTYHFSHGSESFLLSVSPEELRSKLAMGRIIFFGGLGFSGRNEEFNAHNGIYLSAITRGKEIAESEKIAKLHEIVCSAAQNHTLIVCTHCPTRDWTDEKDLSPGVYYISGHTHKNYYVEDDIYNQYEDNQIGYHSHHQNHLKYFNVNGTFDIFADTEDGIHMITAEQYVDFNIGKNIRLSCNREHKAIFMLKKYGYYMFLMWTNSGHLCIMNGGNIKKIHDEDLSTLYDKMDGVIARKKEPLDVFTMMQNRVSSAVRKIGGRGHIHGCIVDIDFYNHIFVNPIDATIHGYFAYDMHEKYFYKSIPALLYQKCPELYAEYCKQLEGTVEVDNSLTVLSSAEQYLEEKPTYHYGMEIYDFSRRVKKYQKLNSNILTVWDTGDESTLLGTN